MISRRLVSVLMLLAVAWPAAVLAQQTGSISGTVTASDGAVLPGVTVEARSDVLPGPRETVTGGSGEYALPALPPGTYTLTFNFPGLQSQTRKAQVQLAQDTVVDAMLAVSGIEETVVVTAEAGLVNQDSPTIATGLTNEEILGLPVGQEYRDLQKLIPGVQYTQDAIRGPSAGGSGQDNVYQFDGVNVTLPQYGTLSAEPASHDIDQVTTVRGAARAVDFDRSGGFSIDSVSKSGTSEYHGQLSYQVQTVDMSADLTSGIRSRYEQDRSWLVANLGGPILKDKLYLYGSYYRPERTRENPSNLYGPLPEYNLERNEGFGKLTFTPITSLLFNMSYRDSKKTETTDQFAANAGPTTGTGGEARLRIGTLEGSWVIGARSFATFNYTHFANETQGAPDFRADVVPSTAPGTQLDIGNLDKLGRLTVPSPITGATEFNAFIQPIIDRYGYTQDGRKVGGGIVGLGQQFDDDDFFRDAGQIGFNITLGTTVSHDLHVGYERYKETEELVRSSNGWGLISVPGGRLAAIPNTGGRRAFFTARIQRQTPGLEGFKTAFESQTIEVNDTIKWRNWAFNVGVLASEDTLFGQGLREDPSTLSGFVAAPGSKYEMYKVPFKKLIQPRTGVTWAYNGKDTVYASYARYNPAVNSLPRAASWDRNLIGQFIDVHFDERGVAFAAVPVGSSSGKLFVEDMTPRRIDEFLIGTARQFGNNWSARLYGRHRRGSHFWEDTNNNARIAFEPPPGIPRELYIPDLSARVAQIGSGSSYVIAELDGAYTRFNEVTLETEWRGEKTFVRGSYTWSEYYGNFDQDNTTTVNDANSFIGSSFIADGAGRQLWNNKDGTLRGDRPHMLKVYGYRMLNWNATVGLFGIFQSGQPWETWSYEPYRQLTSSTDNTNRYAEPAGSRRSDSHWQVDLNYTQNFRFGKRYNIQVVADVFNVFNEQTGYNIQPSFNNSEFGKPRSYFDPRRLQVAARFQF